MRVIASKLLKLLTPRKLDNIKLLVIREGRSGLWEFAISGRALYMILVASLFAFPLIIFIGAQLLLETAHAYKVASLRSDNAQLAAQVEEFEGRLSEFEQDLTTLSELDKDLRAHANIPALPNEIRQIGTGGGMINFETDLDYLLPSDDVSIRQISARVDALYRGLKLEQLSYKDIRDSLKNDLARIRNTPSVRPLEAGSYTSGFGYRRHPYTNSSDQHRGLDISVRSGTSVHTTAGGRVVATRFDRNLGLYVKIDHGNGFQTLYGHLRDITIVQGQRVSRGDEIGHSGSTGRSTAPHLHYEVRHYNEPQNPLNYF